MQSPKGVSRVTKFAKRSLIVFIMVLAFVLPLVFAAGAWAYPGLNSFSESQAAPGQTLRYIYGSCQVYMYPINVSHVGYLHVEMTYDWPDYDCYIYLIKLNSANGHWEQAVNPDGSSTDQQGWNSDFYGKEVIDYFVEDISEEGQQVVPYGEDLVGDTYYVMVQAFADVSNFELRGYTPRTIYEAGKPNPVTGGNWYRERIRFPADGSRMRVYGAPYNSAYYFTPTSEGKVWINTRYPFNPVTKKPLEAYTNPALQAAAFDEYLYPGDWSENSTIWDMAGNGSGHWIQNHTAGTPPPFVMAPDPTWTRRISASSPVADNIYMHPGFMEIYTPLLWQASSDPTQPGIYTEPKSGMSTVGYLGSILYPQNLWLNRSAVVLKKGKVLLAGNLAIAPLWNDPTGAASGTIAWAPAGTVVTIQAKSGDVWKNVGSGKVAGAVGHWAASVKGITGTVKYRAFWSGTRMKSISVLYRAKFETEPGSGVYEWADWQTKPFTAPNQLLYPDGSFDIISKSLDPVNGIAFKSMSAKVNGALLDVTLKKGDPTLTIVFDNKPNQPVEIKFVSTNMFSEFSLGKDVTTSK